MSNPNRSNNLQIFEALAIAANSIIVNAITTYSSSMNKEVYASARVARDALSDLLDNLRHQIITEHNKK